MMRRQTHPHQNSNPQPHLHSPQLESAADFGTFSYRRWEIRPCSDEQTRTKYLSLFACMKLLEDTFMVKGSCLDFLVNKHHVKYCYLSTRQ